jgi:hypothetical protein
MEDPEKTGEPVISSTIIRAVRAFGRNDEVLAFYPASIVYWQPREAGTKRYLGHHEQ